MENKIKEIQNLVSVIVPVYNSEKQIENCIRSIRNQTWKNIEIIIINDGSTDHSSEICERLCLLDKRIYVFHQANYGVSYARNKGMEAARGEYIIFVDSDDELPENSILIRMRSIKTADLLISGYDVIDCNEKQKYNVNGYEKTYCSNNEMLKMMFGEQLCGYQGYLWNKLFRKRIIKDNHLRFEEGIHYNEDRLFIVQYLMKCKNVIFNNECVYRYLINPSGAMEMAKSLSETTYKRMITEFAAFRIMSRELINYDSELYYLCNKDAMGCAIAHKKKADKIQKEARKYFSICIREFSQNCMKYTNISLKERIKLIGHYILTK